MNYQEVTLFSSTSGLIQGYTYVNHQMQKVRDARVFEALRLTHDVNHFLTG